jgi:hypothetical protein
MDYDKQEEKIQKQIAYYQDQVVAFDLLLEGLKKFDGKKVNKRAIHILKGNGYTVHWERDQWTINISVWGNGIDYPSRMFFSIPADARDGRVFDLKAFEKKYYHFSDQKAAERIYKYEQMLENLVDYVVEYNLAVDDFNEAVKRVRSADANFSIV